jgi:tetratricopeptide (TPR) repeat protein
MVVVLSVPAVWALEQPFEQIARRREQREQDARDAQARRSAEGTRAVDLDAKIRDGRARVPQSRAALLSPLRKIVPLLGREADLASLVEWCTTIDPRYPGDVRFHVITGPGGVGKSRLAEALKDTLIAAPITEKPRWQCHTIGRDADTSLIGLIRQRHAYAPVLLVVDYAESRPELRAFLESALSAGGTVRVLMLARTPGRWWEHLAEVPGDLGALVTAGYAHGVDLADADVAPQVLLDAAAGAFATELNLPVPGLRIAETQHRNGALDLTAAALVAVLRGHKHTHITGIETVHAEEVFDELLRHEAGYWQATAEAASLAGSLTTAMRRVLIAAVALLGAADDRTTTALVGRVLSTFTVDRHPEPGDVVRWLRATYPSSNGTQWAEPLQPDRVAEHLVVKVLTGLDGPAPDTAAADRRAAALLEDLPATWASQAMTVLSRAVTDPTRHSHATNIRSLLDRLVTELPDDQETLRGVFDASPYPSPRLAHTALILARRRLRLARQNGTDDVVASHLDWVGVLLSDLGRHSEALPATHEAVTLYRRLAENNPKQYEQDLATSLSNLGIRFSQLDRPDEALEATQQAVAIRLRWAEIDPDRHTSDLARTLNNLSGPFAELGRPIEALSVSQETAVHCRRLANVDPDRYGPELATSLNNLGVRFSQLDRLDEALSVTQEAVAIHRRLTEINPDRYDPDLATSLNNLGATFAQLNRLDEALSVTQEAVAIHRRLTEINPDRYDPDLTNSLNILGIWLSELGRRSEAVDAAERAVTIVVLTLDREPVVNRPRLAESLRISAFVHRKSGQENRAQELETRANEVEQAGDGA